MQFSQALMGGGTGTPCVKTLQVYLWKFVLDFDPTALSRIPSAVKELAFRNGYQLGPEAAPLRSSYQGMMHSLGAPKNPAPSLAAIGEDEEEEEEKENHHLNVLAEEEEEENESDQELTEEEDQGFGMS